MLIRLLPKKLSHLVFRSFEAKDAFLNQVAELRDKNPNRPIAFAVLGGDIIDFWAIRIFLADRFGPSFEPRLATRVSGIFVEPVATLLRRVASSIYLSTKPRSRIRLCSDELLAGRPVVLNFEYTDRKKAFEVPTGEKDLAFLERRIPNLLIVPVVMVWRRKRQTIDPEQKDLGHKLLKGLLAPIRFPKDILLGDPMHPTAIRKLAILLRQYERSTLRINTPLELGSAHPKTLRRKILTSILQERKIILGPALSSPKFIGESIMRNASFTRLVRTLAAEQEMSELSLFQKSEKYFRELSADFSYFTIEALAWVLAWVFSRIFDNLNYDEEALEKLRLTAREGPLLIIPSHKSYFDFLIMSYVLFRNDIAPPHIAAGINLNFWPFGRMLRTGGAFFIRRSFRGNLLYSEVLRRYIAALLQTRHNVEFFIEGARSRNGKLAPPKFGMLKMIVDSKYDHLIQENIQIIPVSINYERVTEAKSHRRELEGGEKVAESFVNLAKSSKVLFKKFGEVDVRLADPISLDQWLLQYVGEKDTEGDIRRLGVQKLAFEVCHRINRSTPVTGAGLVCAILLAKPGAALLKEELEAWLGRLRQDLDSMRVLLNPSLEKDFELACRRALASLIDDKIIEQYEASNGKVGLRIPSKQRVAALYYKNSSIHAFLIAGVAGFAHDSRDDLLELRSLLQFEFFFSEKEVFLRDILHVPGGVMIDLYSLMLDDVFENVATGLRCLIEMRDQTLDEKEWKNRLLKFGRTSILESTVSRPEAVNTQSFLAFVQMAKNKRWLVNAPKEGHLHPAPEAELTKGLERIRQFRGKLIDWETLRRKYLNPHDQEKDAAH